MHCQWHAVAFLVAVLGGGICSHAAAAESIEVHAEGKLHAQKPNRHAKKPHVSIVRSEHASKAPKVSKYTKHKSQRLQERRMPTRMPPRPESQHDRHIRHGTTASVGRAKDAALAEKLKLSLAKCRGEGETEKWPELKKFDLLISWWTNKPQSDHMVSKNYVRPDQGHRASSLLQMEASSRFENQAEIKYALRSFEKHGLLDHVGNVYILVDEDVLKSFGAPRSFNYSNKALHIVTDNDMGVRTQVGQQTKWRKHLAMDKIPNLSEYFLWLPDDNFMMRDFKMNYLYDTAQGKPIMYNHGTYSLGWCDGMRAVGSGHGPVLINKCAYTAVAENFWRPGTNLHLESSESKPIDPLCLYSNSMKQTWIWRSRDQRFLKECHTNGGCSPFDKAEGPLFVNLQGNSVSDEYASIVGKPKWLEKALPRGANGFFHENFPKPSRFEI